MSPGSQHLAIHAIECISSLQFYDDASTSPDHYDLPPVEDGLQIPRPPAARHQATIECWFAGAETPSQTIILAHGIGASLHYPFIKPFFSHPQRPRSRLRTAWLRPIVSSRVVCVAGPQLDLRPRCPHFRGSSHRDQPRSAQPRHGRSVTLRPISGPSYRLSLAHRLIDPPLLPEVTAKQQQMAALIVYGCASLAIDNIVSLLGPWRSARSPQASCARLRLLGVNIAAFLNKSPVKILERVGW